jgi:hypothetical protein
MSAQIPKMLSMPNHAQPISKKVEISWNFDQLLLAGSIVSAIVGSSQTAAKCHAQVISNDFRCQAGEILG